MKLTTKDYIYVSLQCILFGVYAIPVQLLTIDTIVPVKIIGVLFCGIGISIVGIAMLQLHKNISPFPTPKSNSSLITHGIYKYIRHPIYSALLCIAFGYAIYVCSIFKLLIGVLLYLLFILKSKYEEQRLSMFFKDYEHYIKTTGRFFPKK